MRKSKFSEEQATFYLWKIEAWRVDHNQRQPHSSLGHLAPDEFAEQRQTRTIEEVAFPSSELSVKGRTSDIVSTFRKMSTKPDQAPRLL